MGAHLKRYLLRGLLALIPLALVYLVLRLLFTSIDQSVNGLLESYGLRHFPGLGLLVLLVFLYLIGLASSHVTGKYLLGLLERVAKRVPLIGTTWQVGSQLSATLSLPEGQVFNRVVLLPHLSSGSYTIGFVTGKLIDEKSGSEWTKVFVPTPPNPTSGFLAIMRPEELRDPGWTVEEGVRTVISGGMIGPETFCSPVGATLQEPDAGGTGADQGLRG